MDEKVKGNIIQEMPFKKKETLFRKRAYNNLFMVSKLTQVEYFDFTVVFRWALEIGEPMHQYL